MLVAVHQSGRKVNAICDEVTRKDGPFFCPACQSLVRLKKGKVNQPHFAHTSREQCHFFTENESGEHLNLKGQLYRWARLSQVEDVQLEHCLPQLGQIADVMLGSKIALEVQCSSLPLERLKERTDSYHRGGFEVVWLLGQKLWLRDSLTPLQRHFLYFSQNRGFYLWELDEKRQRLRLKYLIHEDLHGKVQHLTEEFAFDKGNLLDCLRQPFKRQPLAQLQGRLDSQIHRYISQQLYYRNPRWLAKQAQLYEQGKNLLTQEQEDFYPQIIPVQGDDFTQVRQDLTPYYTHFQTYYQSLRDKTSQMLYSPIFYDKIKNTEDFTHGQK